MLTCISFPTRSLKNLICRESMINESRDIEGCHQLPLSRNSGCHNKKIVAGAQPGFFQGRRFFIELGHFNKHFVKNTIEKVPQGKILEFFSQDTLKIIFRMEKLAQRWTKSGPFFPKFRALFSIFKKQHERPPPFPLPNSAPE